MKQNQKCHYLSGRHREFAMTLRHFFQQQQTLPSWNENLTKVIDIAENRCYIHDVSHGVRAYVVGELYYPLFPMRYKYLSFGLRRTQVKITCIFNQARRRK